MLEARSESGDAREDPYFTRKQRSYGRGCVKKDTGSLKKENLKIKSNNHCNLARHVKKMEKSMSS